MQEEGSVVQRWEEAGDSGRSVFRQSILSVLLRIQRLRLLGLQV